MSSTPTPPARAHSIDDFLGGKIQLAQPIKGYRITMDTILLAAAVPARAGESVLDLGAGSGGAALALAARVEGVSVIGLEPACELLEFARYNAALNGLDDRVSFEAGSVQSPTDKVRANFGKFHHAMANPPYFRADEGDASPDEEIARARVASDSDVGDWINLAVGALRHRGSMTFIYPAARMDALVAAIQRCGAGDITLFPLWPFRGIEAKRVIVQARKAGRGPARILPGLVLHSRGERYTAAAEAVLRDAKPLTFGR